MGLNARSDVVPIDASLVPNFVLQITVSQYYQVAIAFLLVYDAKRYGVYRPSEISFPSPKTDIRDASRKCLGNLLILSILLTAMVASSAPFLSSTGIHFMSIVHREIFAAPDLSVLLFACFRCVFSVWMFTVCNWMTIVFIDYILMIRVLALFHQERRLVICLKAFLALEAAFKFGMEIANRSIQPILVAGLAGRVTFCAVDKTHLMPHALLVFDALVPTIYGAILMALGLFKATEYWKASAGFQGFVLVKVLIQDQVVYFMVVIICGVFHVLNIVLDIRTSFLSDVFVQLGNATFLCLLGSRMLYNLKDAGERGQNEGTSFRVPSKPLSKMNFVSPRNIQRFFHISFLGDINLIWLSDGEIQVDLNDVGAYDRDG
ncbi:hypothetical protein A7U60_g5658 [Sanghuangporus baumii]|uniref:Uncharacterized protein n=1 Tax=Sanghuangporus baumii TaxID=108892 RepID=A0A9Q5HWA8_SANBA|nr:hypothetical protein A7U60_g5658 [Sanghuangporus baumii]